MQPQYHVQYVPARTNHLLHAVFTFFTLGLWFPIWVTVWVYNHNRSVARQVPYYPPAPVMYLPGQYPLPVNQPSHPFPPQG